MTVPFRWVAGFLAAAIIVFACEADPDGSSDATSDPTDLVDSPLSDQDSAEDRGTPVCPPPEPHGHDVDSTLTNLTFEDCDGTPVALHDLCGANAGLVFNFYGWCTGCYRFLSEANAIHQDYASAGLVTIIVVSEDAIERPATSEYCQTIREQYDLQMTVVADPEGTLEAYGDADLVMITNDYAEIIFKRIGPTVDTIRSVLEGEL